MASNSQFIISCIQENWPNIPISQQLLDHPTSEFVVEVYQHFQDTMNETENKMCNIEPAPTEEPKPNCDPIFSNLRFANKYLKRLFNPADVNCMLLTLTDLYEPTAKRTKLIFKMLLNIMLFYTEQQNPVRDIVMKQLGKAESCAKKRKEKESLKEKSAEEAVNVARAEDEYGKLEKEEQKANLRFKSLHEQKDARDMQHEKMRHDLLQLTDTYRNKQALLKNLKTNVVCLNEQIVTEASYKTLLDLKENLVKKCSELEEEIEGLANNLGNRRPEGERFENINKNLITLKSACEELRELQNSVTSTNAELQKSEENYQQKSDELKTCKKNALKYKENTKTIKEALQGITLKNNTLKEKMAQQLELLKLELINEQQLQNDISRDKVVYLEKINETQNEIEEIRLQIEKLNLYYAETYKQLLNSENFTTTKFSKMLENIEKKLSQDPDSAA